MQWLKGRSDRREYWVQVAVLITLGLLLSGGGVVTSLLLTVFLILVQVRRVHDFGRSGWWAVGAAFAPLAIMLPLMAAASAETAIVPSVLVELALIAAIGAIPGTPGENRFGPPAPFAWKRALTGR